MPALVVQRDGGAAGAEQANPAGCCPAGAQGGVMHAHDNDNVDKDAADYLRLATAGSDDIRVFDSEGNCATFETLEMYEIFKEGCWGGGTRRYLTTSMRAGSSSLTGRAVRSPHSWRNQVIWCRRTGSTGQSPNG
jgi:hypothetical protein